MNFSIEAKINDESAETSKNSFNKITVLIVVVIAIALFWVFFRDWLTIENLVVQEAGLRSYFQSNPVVVFAAAFLLYVLVAALALPGAALLSLVYAWFFGFWPALMLISFASTLGATICFLLSRFLFRDTIEKRFSSRLSNLDAKFKRDGAFYLFSLRLIPAIPFFLVNLLMGLSPIKAATFWWVSQIGMLPGTAVFVYAGASFPSLKDLEENGVQGILSINVIIAFVLLAIFPWAARKLLNAFKKPAAESRLADGG